MSVKDSRVVLEYLFDFLADEFRHYPEVRVRVRQRAVTQRSPDLEQDYDPESSNLHKALGVDVRARGREYFFPIEWAEATLRSQLDAQVREVKRFLG